MPFPALPAPPLPPLFWVPEYLGLFRPPEIPLEASSAFVEFVFVFTSAPAALPRAHGGRTFGQLLRAAFAQGASASSASRTSEVVLSARSDEVPGGSAPCTSHEQTLRVRGGQPRSRWKNRSVFLYVERQQRRGARGPQKSNATDQIPGKRAGDDKKLSKMLEQQLIEELATSPGTLSSSPLGPLSESSTRTLLIDLIITMIASFPDYDFSALRPEQFQRNRDLGAVINHINGHLADLDQSDMGFNAASGKTFLGEIWKTAVSVSPASAESRGAGRGARGGKRRACARE